MAEAHVHQHRPHTMTHLQHELGVVPGSDGQPCLVWQGERLTSERPARDSGIADGVVQAVKGPSARGQALILAAAGTRGRGKRCEATLVEGLRAGEGGSIEPRAWGAESHLIRETARHKHATYEGVTARSIGT